MVSHIGKTFLFCDAHSVFLFVFGLDLNLLSYTWFKLVYGRFLNATALSNFASCFSYNTFNNGFHKKTINTMWLWSAMNNPPVNKDRISSSTPNLTIHKFCTDTWLSSQADRWLLSSCQKTNVMVSKLLALFHLCCQKGI